MNKDVVIEYSLLKNIILDVNKMDMDLHSEKVGDRIAEIAEMIIDKTGLMITYDSVEEKIIIHNIKLSLEGIYRLEKYYINVEKDTDVKPILKIIISKIYSNTCEFIEKHI